MRLISQNGAIDVPYEMSAIRNDDGLIIICMAGETGKGSVIARYSTSEKAEKAIQMLREYKETKEIRSIPLTKSLMESFSNVKMENFEIYTDGTGDYLKVDIVKKVEYFQFPQDEDVEV